MRYDPLSVLSLSLASATLQMRSCAKWFVGSRTTAMIGLIDCAMRIYTNYPCRLALAELEVDLPCKEAIFASQHPFMQDESIFAPRLTISQAFALLFDKLSPPPLSTAPTSVVDPKLSSAAAATSQSLNNLFDCDLTVFNLFILIHCKYMIHAVECTHFGVIHCQYTIFF